VAFAVVGVHEVGEAVGARVVDEHVDLAERAHDLPHGRPDRGRVGGVARPCEPVQLARHGARALLVDIADRDPRPLGGQAPSGRGTDARRAAP
jgi:hypothetical protein